MLEQIDLSRKTSKTEFKEIISALEIETGELQRKARELGVPVIIVFEGWDAAGKGTLINRIIMAMDARGYKVHPVSAPNDEERFRPFLWRFWTKTPEKGRIALFDRSWYGKVLVERVDRIVKKKEWVRAYEEINAFERQLTDDGTVIIKFFLHISQEEQKKRFLKLKKNRATAWKVTREDWKHHKQYDRYKDAIEEMLVKTSTAPAPWTIVESHNRRFAAVKAFEVMNNTLKRKIEEAGQPKKEKMSKSGEKPSVMSSILEKTDLKVNLSVLEYESRLNRLQKRLRSLEHEVFLNRVPVVIVYQGWDAAGKGGNIRRLIQGMDPRGYEVIPIAAPSEEERRHHYLWRFWKQLPKAGHITIFDRSWYERLMVERVEGFCTEQEWRRAFREINEMEEHLHHFGSVIIKFWLQIDKAEQLRRFKSRQELPEKQWKITDEDWRNRKKWDQYRVAVDEMLLRTSTACAPWTIVEATCKRFARIKALQNVVDVLEKRLSKK